MVVGGASWVLFLFSFAVAGHALAGAVQTHEYVFLHKGVRSAYVSGVFDTALDLQLFPWLDECAVDLRVRGILTTDDLRDLVDAWLKEHRDQWDYSLPGLMVTAVRDYCAGQGFNVD